MFVLCFCGKMIYYLDKDCPYCGRDIKDERSTLDDESGSENKYDQLQMRLFEC